MNITVMYTCHLCGIVKAKVWVPERGQEDVIAFTERTALLCGQDHDARSPKCQAGKLDLWIPVPAGAERIGEPPIN